MSFLLRALQWFSSQFKIKAQVLYDGLEGPTGSGSCLLCDLIFYHLSINHFCCHPGFLAVPEIRQMCPCLRAFARAVLSPLTLAPQDTTGLTPSPPLSLCTSVTSSLKPALTTHLNWTFLLCSPVPLPCYNSLLRKYRHLSSSQSMVQQSWRSPRHVQTIFMIIRRCYLPFSLCWHLHRWYKGSGGKTAGTLAWIGLGTPNCIIGHFVLHCHTHNRKGASFT